MYETDSPLAIATQNAALAGVIFVTAAGNDGDSYYLAGGHGDSAIVAAASLDNTSWLDGLRVNSPAAIAGVIAGLQGNDFTWKSGPTEISGTLVYPSSQQTGCDPFSSANAALLAGKVALLDYTGSCGSRVRGNNAADAGAKGVVLVRSILGADDSFAGCDRIPVFVVDATNGDKLKANLASGVGVTFRKDLLRSSKVVNDTWTDTVATWSSRGPRLGGSALRPDVTAPGVTVLTPGVGTGAGTTLFGGTSCAAPHVAGAIALLRQLHPNWTGQELKALLMNTATHDLSAATSGTPPVHGLSRVGAGRIDLENAAGSQVIAFDEQRPELVSVSFGVLDVVGSTAVERPVRVVNKGASPVTL
jgi:subtilisin family serine protease